MLFLLSLLRRPQPPLVLVHWYDLRNTANGPTFTEGPMTYRATDAVLLNARKRAETDPDLCRYMAAIAQVAS